MDRKEKASVRQSSNNVTLIKIWCVVCKCLLAEIKET